MYSVEKKKTNKNKSGSLFSLFKLDDPQFLHTLRSSWRIGPLGYELAGNHYHTKQICKYSTVPPPSLPALAHTATQTFTRATEVLRLRAIPAYPQTDLWHCVARACVRACVSSLRMYPISHTQTQRLGTSLRSSLPACNPSVSQAAGVH